MFFCYQTILIAQTAPFFQQNRRGKYIGRTNLDTSDRNSNTSVDLIYTGDFFSNTTNGYKQTTDFCYVVDLIVSGKYDSLFWERNVSFGFDFVGIEGGNPSNNVGDYQGISSIAAPRIWRPYETWIQLDIVNNKHTILFGMFDINSEYYYNELSALFVHSAFAIGPEFSQNGNIGAPTYPNPGVGVRLKTALSNTASFKIAFMDGDPTSQNDSWREYYKVDRDEGVLLISELSFVSNEEKLMSVAPSSKRIQRRRHRIRPGQNGNMFSRRRNRILKNRNQITDIPVGLYYKISLGGWYYNSDFDVHNNDVCSTLEINCQKYNRGFYFTGENTIWQEKNNPIRALSTFFHFGFSDKNVNVVDISMAGGLVYSGLIFKRVKNQIGFGISTAHLSDKYKNSINRRIKSDNLEIATELSYRAQVNNVFSLQPDIQYIINPGFEPDNDNALVIGMRCEIVL